MLAIALVIWLAIDFAIVAGLFWLICLCFGWTFLWRYAMGVWLILAILHIFVRTGGGEK